MRAHQGSARGEWIASKLPMSSATNVSQRIRRLEKAGERGRLSEPLKACIKLQEHS
ncbi:hypothetical protein [Prosthecobacter sp. SYSU 5D2]|uniref:hypothetical protein n=1 Tax=Prosthecobacter sp. SYSU 5D2 TaxID=3134134 RepID=UPI0031FEE4C5